MAIEFECIVDMADAVKCKAKNVIICNLPAGNISLAVKEVQRCWYVLLVYLVSGVVSR